MATSPRLPSPGLFLFSIMSITVLEFFQNSQLNFAATYVMGGLGATPEEYSYGAMAYGACAVVAIFKHRWLSDRLGVRRFVAISLVIYTQGTALCALAERPPLFILARAIQGVGGATFFTAARLQLNRFEGKDRLLALLVFGYTMMIGSALGPLLGSYMLQRYSWRWVFWSVLPFVLLAAACLPRLQDIPPVDPPIEYHPGAMVWLLVSAFALQFLFQQTPYDFFSRPGLLLALGGLWLVSGLIFLFRYRRSASDTPYWDHLVQKRYLFGLSAYLLLYVLVAGNNYVLPQLLQSMGFDVPTAGLLLSVSFFSGMVCATIYAKILLSPWRPGLKHAMAFATLLLAAYGYLMAHLDDTATTGQIAALLVLNGGFLSIFISAVAIGTFQEIRPEAFAHAYITKNVLRQTALSFSVSAANVFLQSRNSLHYNRLRERFSLLDDTFLELVRRTRELLPQLSLEQVVGLWQQTLVRQTQLMSCLDFYQMFFVAGLGLALVIAWQRVFR